MTEVIDVAPSASRVAPAATIREKAWLVSELALAWLVIHLYGLEGSGLLKVFGLAVGGFAVSLAIPQRQRLPFFVGVSMLGIVAVLGWRDAAWLLLAALILIGIGSLPVRFGAKVLALLAVAGALGLSRTGIFAPPWSAAVWPVLSSMFIFRLVLYVLSVRAGQAARWPWEPLAYFLMLPNVAFPLFPVVDYQTFRRTYFDRAELRIYEQGLQWIVRGLVHLVAYRFVYHNFLYDAGDVRTLGDLVQLMLATLLLYLKVSGQFHLIVGILHLFGFRLPETNHLYYLSRGFTDLWRRINIYWKDFMMKVVFYPTFFRFRRLWPRQAVALSTAAVFVSTWLLHSYQWFWLRGGFPLTVPDVLFWGILGCLVVVGAVRESREGLKPGRAVGTWRLDRGLRVALTFCSFCLLWSLWYSESVGGWLWTLGAAAQVDGKGILLLAAVIVTLTVLGGRDWAAGNTAASPVTLMALSPAIRTCVPLAILLAVAVIPSTVMPPPLAGVLSSLRNTGPNAADAALRHRGYYEQLNVAGRKELAFGVTANRREWVDLSATGTLRDRSDLLLRDLHPSRCVIWNGNVFSTNRWGMRDREYELAKSPGTLRIALLGPSHAMGNGVPDGATFENLLEERLNRELPGGRYERFEVLNFAVDGYTLTQQVRDARGPRVAIRPRHHHRHTLPSRASHDGALPPQAGVGLDPPAPRTTPVAHVGGRAAQPRPGMAPGPLRERAGAGEASGTGAEDAIQRVRRAGPVDCRRCGGLVVPAVCGSGGLAPGGSHRPRAQRRNRRCPHVCPRWRCPCRTPPSAPRSVRHLPCRATRAPARRSLGRPPQRGGAPLDRR